MQATRTRTSERETERGAISIGPLLALAVLLIAALLLRPAPTLAHPDGELERGIGTATFYALDYRRTSYDFTARSFVWGAQIDERYRELPGDLHFDGERLNLVEDTFWTGVILDLGADAQPDNEFSLFYGLSVDRRRFYLREFPYRDQVVLHDGIDAETFFGRPDAPRLSAPIELGHTYAIRIAHQTRVGVDRLYLVRVLDFTPGVKATLIWRELPASGPGLEPRLPPRTNRGDIRGR